MLLFVCLKCVYIPMCLFPNVLVFHEVCVVLLVFYAVRTLSGESGLFLPRTSCYFVHKIIFSSLNVICLYILLL